MDSKFKFLRSFLIFDQEDSRFREGGDPSGYVKIEVREGRGKLSCQVSNLKEDNYKLYMIKTNDSELVPICVGLILLKKGRGELNWTFNPSNVNGSGLTIEDFNIAAVLVESDNERFGNVACPLVSYKDNKIEWRQKMRRFLNNQRTQKDETLKKLNSEKTTNEGKNITNENKDNIDKEIISKYESVLESKYTKLSSEGNDRKESGADYGAKKGEKEYTGITQNDNEQAKNFKSEKENDEIEYKGGNITEQTKENKQEQSNEERNTKDQRIQDSNIEERNIKNQNVQPHNNQNVQAHNKKEENLNSANYRNNTDCINCFGKNAVQNNNKSEGVDYKPGIRELTESFDKYFEKYNPFRGGRKEYRWWKVSSPVHLNNILYQMDIKIPILFNPIVLMAHFKHRHLIVGTYEDNDRDLSYIVCGVPGVYWVDEKPFGNMCRWAQVEGNVPKYGAFGYWLVYINTKTGEILNIG